MTSRFRACALAALVAAATGGAMAQDVALGWSPRTGDVWVDARLGDINRYADRYREPFVDEMTRYYSAPRDLVSDLIVNRHWAPGDVYYACAIAQVIGRPCRYVVDEWNRDHGQGWGAVAQGLGIKPGSAEFHRLKRGFVPTYDRWSRPIELDHDLQRDFPNRGKGPAKANPVKGSPAVHPAAHGAGKSNRGKPAGNGSQDKGNRGHGKR